MAVEVIKTDLPEILLIKPRVFGDERGFFCESFNQSDWESATGLSCRFVQDNHSRSVRGVLRGLHYQLPPAAQGKLVRTACGEIFDVAVDLRRNSPTFGRWVGRVLSEENQLQMWIPAGFGHGFLTLSTSADVIYKTTAYYAPEWERAVAWDDPELMIEWSLQAPPLLSEKDRRAPCLRDAELFQG